MNSDRAHELPGEFVVSVIHDPEAGETKAETVAIQKCGYGRRGLQSPRTMLSPTNWKSEATGKKCVLTAARR
jgi:hypothetical protein